MFRSRYIISIDLIFNNLGKSSQEVTRSRKEQLSQLTPLGKPPTDNRIVETPSGFKAVGEATFDKDPFFSMLIDIEEESEEVFDRSILK